MRNRRLISAVLLAFVVSSCSLDIDETDSLITEGSSDVFNGVTDPGSAITNLYNNISSQAGDQANLFALQEVTTDELMVLTRGTDWGDNGIWRTLHQHTMGPNHAYINQVWNDKNSAVLRATEIIDPLTDATDEEIAQAKFVRAYNMWLVMDFWGQVPFRNPVDGPEVTPSVFTRAEAYDFIVQDLTDAIADLPSGSSTSDTKTTAVKATAKFLLAKIKLQANVYKGDYGAGDLQDVIELVDEIETGGYAIVGGGYFDIFVGPEFTNTDVIWNVPAGVGNRMWNGLHYNQPAKPGEGNDGGGWNGFTTLAEFYDKFEGDPNENVLGGDQEERRGFTQTLASTNEDNFGFGFGFQIGQMFSFSGGSAKALTDRGGAPLVFTREVPGLVGNNERTGIRVLKWSPANGAFTEGLVMARFADAHLMRAEARLRLGNTTQALEDVNFLRRKRANTPDLTSISESALLDERGRELYLEGWRRHDLIRFGVFKDAWQFKEAGDGHTDLFPIPASALLSNPNLVQNEGY
ncbi:MAG: RagB/SusD family nutrient uptake outer membrane protein [Cyclobacteriaceae bacterium]|nr:RagB/SusD family nutrient uptake outer membrane protein [Cyclobacteriaceae bacterium]